MNNRIIKSLSNRYLSTVPLARRLRTFAASFGVRGVFVAAAFPSVVGTAVLVYTAKK